MNGNRLRYILAIICVLMISVRVYATDTYGGGEQGAETVTQEWVVRYDGPDNYHDKPRAIATDDDGNVYVTGGSYGINTEEDYATIKYDPYGNLLWTARYNGPYNTHDYAKDIAVDTYGNVYVTGESVGADLKMDYATIKYDPNGNQLWVARYVESPNVEKYAQALVVDSWGNVYVTGRAFHGSADWVTIKYSPDGDQLWADTYDGPLNLDDEATDIILDRSGCVYVTGKCNSIWSFFNGYIASDCATIKYSPEGVREWVSIYTGIEDSIDMPGSIVVDDFANVYIVGGSDGNCVTIKYDATDGSELWVARDYPGRTGKIGLDAAGNVYISGESFDGSSWPDYLTIKYDPNGHQEWASTYNGPSNHIDFVTAMVVDSLGNTYVTGESVGSGFATVKYDTDGNEIWVVTYRGPDNSADWATAITQDVWGNIYVTSGSFGTSYDYATIKYVQHPAIPRTLRVPSQYRTIQDAIDAAVDGDTVVVLPGIYTGDGNRDIDFKGKAITVKSENGPKNCIIFCDGTEASPHRGFKFHNNEGADSILTGFTITGGYGQKDEGSPGFTRSVGGAISCKDSSPTISNCTIIGNSSERDGGGIYCKNSSLSITECIINSNFVTWEWARGGGIQCVFSNLNITNCVINNNFAGYGGGIVCERSNLTIKQCIISNNFARYGGGIDCERSNMMVNFCTITDNLASDGGGGILCWKSTATTSNSILWGNKAIRYGPEISLANDPNPSHLTIFHTDIKGGRAAIHTSSSRCTVNWGEGNINADPLFLDPANSDYCLQSGSPCIDAGCDTGVYEDIEGNDRPWDCPWVDNNGPEVEEFDMGAYEFVAVEAEMKITPRTLNCRSKGNWIKAHLTLPEGYTVENVYPNHPMIIEPFGIESDYMNIFVNDDGLVEIEASFNRQEFCDAAGDWPKELIVLGWFTNGESFYGKAGIRIITPGLKEIADLSSQWLQTGCKKPHWCDGLDMNQDSVVNLRDFALFQNGYIEIFSD